MLSKMMVAIARKMNVMCHPRLMIHFSYCLVNLYPLKPEKVIEAQNGQDIKQIDAGMKPVTPKTLKTYMKTY